MKSLARIHWPAALVALVGGVLLSIAASWACLWFSPCSTELIRIERAGGGIRAWSVHPSVGSERLVDLEPHVKAWPVTVPNDWPAHPSLIDIVRGVGVKSVSASASIMQPTTRRMPPHTSTGRLVSAAVVRWGWPATMFEVAVVTSGNASKPSAINGALPDRFKQPTVSSNPRFQSHQTFRVAWGGAVVNTAVFAALIALVIAAVRTGVRASRLKRGRCTRCGYKVDGLRCPECGFANG